MRRSTDDRHGAQNAVQKSKTCKVHSVFFVHSHHGREEHEALQTGIGEAPAVIHLPVKEVCVPLGRRKRDRADAPNLMISVHVLDHQSPVRHRALAPPSVPCSIQRAAGPVDSPAVAQPRSI